MTTPDVTGDRMPVLYLSHGAPPLADDPVWTEQLAGWSRDLPRPKSILVVSAHWESAPLAVGATQTVPLTYDFWGFPEHYYQVTYAAPGAPELAKDVAALLTRPGQPVHQDADRGLDHGAYVPLVEMFPEADIPVLQVSMPTLDPRGLFEIGRRLAPLRDDGVLIMGSGFTTHNLSLATFGLGYMGIVFTEERRGLADLLAGTRVIEELPEPMAVTAPSPPKVHLLGV